MPGATSEQMGMRTRARWVETGVERRAASSGHKRWSTLTWSVSGEDRQGEAALPSLVALVLWLLALRVAEVAMGMTPVAAAAAAAAAAVIGGGEGKGSSWRRTEERRYLPVGLGLHPPHRQPHRRRCQWEYRDRYRQWILEEGRPEEEMHLWRRRGKLQRQQRRSRQRHHGQGTSCSRHRWLLQSTPPLALLLWRAW